MNLRIQTKKQGVWLLRFIFRDFKKHKLRNLIAILSIGLSIGIACCILILSFIRHELHVNKNFKNSNHIFRVSSGWKEEGMGIPICTLGPIGPLLLENFPGVINQNRSWGGWITLKTDFDNYRESLLVTDESFFEIFVYLQLVLVFAFHLLHLFQILQKFLLGV